MKPARASSVEGARFELRRAARAEAEISPGGNVGAWIAAAIVIAAALAPIAAPIKVVALVVAAAAMVLRRGARPAPIEPAGFVVIDDAGIARDRGGAIVPLASWSAQFGVTLLANESRDRGLLAFTTAEHTRFVAVRAAGDDDARAARELFARASTVADADVAGDPNANAASKRGGGDALSAGDALRVLSAVRSRDASALGRILLTDSRGAPLLIDGDELRAGDRAIDLASPLEWRAFTFVESTGTTASLVQATWVRQQATDVVLVAAVAEGGVAREHASSAPPPAPELRVAVERLFMAPFKDAVARAPRASRAPAPMLRARNVDRRA